MIIKSDKTLQELTVKELFTILYIGSLLGLPYRWGGDDTIEGFDCSGLVIEILQSQGKLSSGKDYSSNGLYKYFKDLGAKEINEYPDFGDIVFFGKSKESISHVGFIIDTLRMVEASGGDSTVKSRNDAEKKNAYVKISQISKRKDLVSILRLENI